MKNNDLKKAYFWNTLGSGMFSFLSFFYLVIVTRINGSNIAGVFSICFATACIVYCGTLYCGRTYQVTENDKSICDKDYILQRFICAFFAIIITLIFGLLNSYKVFKFIILFELCFLKIIEAISDVYHGILQKNNKLDVVGKLLFSRSIIQLIVFIIIDLFFKNLVFSCLSINIVSIIFLIFYDRKFAIDYIEFKNNIKKDSIIKIFKYGFYIFAISFLANYLYNIPRYALDELLSNKFQAIYGIIIMPASILMLANQFLIQPLLITLKKTVNDNNLKKLTKLILIMIAVTIVIGIISLIFCRFFGISILSFIYRINLNNYLNSLLLIILGATFYTIASIFSNVFIVLRKNRIQLYIYILVLIFAFFISRKMVMLYSFDGAIYSYLFIMIILCLAYLLSGIVILYKLKKEVIS